MKLPRHLIFTLVLSLWVEALSVHAQPQSAWVARYDGGLAVGTNEVVAAVLAPSGDIIVAGSGTSASGDWDYLTVKYSPTGERLWARRLNSGFLGTGESQQCWVFSACPLNVRCFTG